MDDPMQLAINRILFGTTDPTVNLEGTPVPALTTLLYRVCDENQDKFKEATRVVELFIRKAIEQ